MCFALVYKSNVFVFCSLPFCGCGCGQRGRFRYSTKLPLFNKASVIQQGLTRTNQSIGNPVLADEVEGPLSTHYLHILYPMHGTASHHRQTNAKADMVRLLLIIHVGFMHRYICDKPARTYSQQAYIHLQQRGLMCYPNPF